MDLGLSAKVVWLSASASRWVWDLAGTFLAEGAFVRVVTTRDASDAAAAPLQLRFGQSLRVERAGGDLCLLSRTLRQRLLAQGRPDVIVLVQTTAEGDPSAHEWDEFLRSRAGELRDGGTVVVVSPHGAPSGDAPEAIASWLKFVQQQRQIWVALTPDDCAVSFIAAAVDLSGHLAGADRARHPTQGLSELTVYMASLGRGLTALVTDDGATHFV